MANGASGIDSVNAIVDTIKSVLGNIVDAFTTNAFSSIGREADFLLDRIESRAISQLCMASVTIGTSNGSTTE